MNLPSESCSGLSNGESLRSLPQGSSKGDALSAFLVTERVVAPYEFRALTGDDMETMSATLELQDVRHIGNRSFASRGATDTSRGVGIGRGTGTWRDRAEWESTLAEAENTARQEGLEDGEKEGRRAARAEMEVEMRQSLARERERLAEAVKQFRETRDCYFAGVEQEVVKLALAIAARVLHREAQVDPLLLAGVVRVALEKMADRSGVVLRVCGADVEAWEGVFRATESSERPRVSEDARLERGECVLETSMGTVELGVSVQLEEIEKGFFDLLNHRPVE